MNLLKNQSKLFSNIFTIFSVYPRGFHGRTQKHTETFLAFLVFIDFSKIFLTFYKEVLHETHFSWFFHAYCD